LSPQELKLISEHMKCCPVDNSFRLIGKKFTIHILRNMMFQKQTRFNQFLDTIEKVNPKTLSVRLREMERAGLITRKVFHEVPVRVEYSLTEKGKALQPIIEKMAEFSMLYCCKDVFKDGKPRTLKKFMEEFQF